MWQDAKDLEGVNWFQLQWEHLVFVSERNLGLIRDKVLHALLLHMDALKVVSDTESFLRDKVNSLRFRPSQPL